MDQAPKPGRTPEDIMRDDESQGMPSTEKISQLKNSVEELRKDVPGMSEEEKAERSRQAEDALAELENLEKGETLKY